MGRPSVDLYRSAPLAVRDKICCPGQLQWRLSRLGDFSNSIEISFEL